MFVWYPGYQSTFSCTQELKHQYQTNSHPSSRAKAVGHIWAERSGWRSFKVFSCIWVRVIFRDLGQLLTFHCLFYPARTPLKFRGGRKWGWWLRECPRAGWATQLKCVWNTVPFLPVKFLSSAKISSVIQTLQYEWLLKAKYKNFHWKQLDNALLSSHRSVCFSFLSKQLVLNLYSPCLFFSQSEKIVKINS